MICQSYNLGFGLTHLTENRSIVLSYFLLRPTTDIVVRMAERSKAPDSRLSYLSIAQRERAFWSPNGGVGLFLFFFRFCFFCFCFLFPFSDLTFPGGSNSPADVCFSFFITFAID